MTEENINYWQEIEKQAQAGAKKIQEQQDRERRNLVDIVTDLRKKITPETVEKVRESVTESIPHLARDRTLIDTETEAKINDFLLPYAEAIQRGQKSATKQNKDLTAIQQMNLDTQKERTAEYGLERLSKLRPLTKLLRETSISFFTPELSPYMNTESGHIANMNRMVIELLNEYGEHINPLPILDTSTTETRDKWLHDLQQGRILTEEDLDTLQRQLQQIAKSYVFGRKSECDGNCGACH